MAVTRSSVHVSVPVERLIEDLILGATTLDKGLAELLPMSRKQRTLNRFYAAGDNLTARVPLWSNTTAADAATKDEKQIVLTEFQFSDTIDPVEFNQDWDFLWTQGSSVDAAMPAELENTLISVIAKNINNTIEKIIWQGDIGGGGSGGLQLLDGLIKLIDADVTVNSATTLGAITAANVIGVFENLLAATPAEVRELSNPTIITSHNTKYLYHESARALDFKGSNIAAAIEDVFGGFPIVSTHGIPADRVFLMNAGGGQDSEAKVGVWADADRMNIKLAKANPLDDVVGIRARFDMGVEYVYGKQITEYSPA